MSSEAGIIALMGSGELTATMVEVHKELIARLGPAPNPVFLDTPAGFQLNADQLSQRAVEYFRVHVGCRMEVASFKARDIPPRSAEEAFRRLREADYILVGPGSPTYAVRQWSDTPIPDILARRIEAGSCLVAASAAALTVGRFALPVYEIYKVGTELHWVDGLGLLSRFGLNILVIPHWNNAEGGTHDTRFCFMGESRFRKLESMLPEDVGVLGIDEHTACIIDLERKEFEIKGIGTATLRRGAAERVFTRGKRFPLAALAGEEKGAVRTEQSVEMPASAPESLVGAASFWERLHAIEEAFSHGLDHDPGDATNALLDLDRLIWSAEEEKEDPEFISQAREMFREFVVLLGARLSAAPGDLQECLAPLVDELIALRASFREKKQWEEADAIRSCLKRANIEIRDTETGHSWRLITGQQE